MKKRTVSTKICGSLLCLIMMALLLSACGKKEQTGAESAGMSGQKEDLADSGDGYASSTETQTGESEMENLSPDIQNGAERAGDGQNGPGAENKEEQSGQSADPDSAQSEQHAGAGQGAGAVQSGQEAQNGNSSEGGTGARNPEAESMTGAQSPGTESL